jgi:cytochrome c oxidase subunit 4
MPRYVLTWVALVALTALSFGASFMGLGALEIPVALIIATVKGGLIALVFMQLYGGRFAYAFAFLVALAFMGIFIGLTTADVLTRRGPDRAPPIVSDAANRPR